MAVTVTERTQARTANEAEKGYQFGYEYLVQSDVDIDEFVAMNAAGIPRRGQAHPWVRNSRVDNRTAKPLDANQGDLKSWVVSVNFAPSDKEDNDDDRELHPLQRPADIRWASSTFSKVFQKDVETGDAIVNSAGQQMDPLPEGDDARAVLTITINKQDFSASDIIRYVNKVNRGPFAGSDAKTVKLQSLSAVRKIETWQDETVVYWEVTYEFHFSEDGWEIELLDQGYMERIDGVLKRIEKDGEPVPDPVFLNGDGQQSDEPVFLKFSIYKRESFSSFRLPI